MSKELLDSCTKKTEPELSKAVAEAIGWEFDNVKLIELQNNYVCLTSINRNGIQLIDRRFNPAKDLEQAMQLAFSYKLTLYFSDRDIIWNNEYGEPIYLDFGGTTKSLCEAICMAVIQIEEDKKC